MMKRSHLASLVMTSSYLMALCGPVEAQVQTLWQLDSLTSIGGHAATVTGDPQVVSTPFGDGLLFDGDDGLIVDANPIAGAEQFTLEMIFRPDPIARRSSNQPRVFHVQSSGSDHRAILETRVVGEEWYLDAFLRSRSVQDESQDASLTLVDSALRYPLGEWYNFSIVYDGMDLHAYLDSQLQLSDQIAVGPLSAGQTSLGMRHNRIRFFEGAIAQVRFTPFALDPSQFLAVPEPSAFVLGCLAVLLVLQSRVARALGPCRFTGRDPCYHNGVLPVARDTITKSSDMQWHHREPQPEQQHRRGFRYVD